MNILFIDCTKSAYDDETLAAAPMGGIQSATARLALQLAASGMKVSVMNARNDARMGGGVRWLPRGVVPDTQHYDAVIVNNEPKLFDLVKPQIAKGAKPYMWLHNPAGLWKFIRKGRIMPLLRYRPHAVFIGTVQRREGWYMRDASVILHSIPPFYFSTPRETPPQNKDAVFISKSYRGLRYALHVWRDKIHPRMNRARFIIFSDVDGFDHLGISDAEAARCGIVRAARLPRPELAAALQDMRLMFYPGHADETFCLAAAEASALGLPIVTRGIGSLSERVVHGKTGYVASCDNDIADHVCRLMTDDGVWMDMHRNSIAFAEAYRDAHSLASWRALLADHMG